MDSIIRAAKAINKNRRYLACSTLMDVEGESNNARRRPAGTEICVLHRACRFPNVPTLMTFPFPAVQFARARSNAFDKRFSSKDMPFSTSPVRTAVPAQRPYASLHFQSRCSSRTARSQSTSPRPRTRSSALRRPGPLQALATPRRRAAPPEQSRRVQRPSPRCRSHYVMVAAPEPVLGS